MKTKHDPQQVFEAFPEIPGEMIQDELLGIGEEPFTHYAFYRPTGRRRRAYYFTCCAQVLEIGSGDLYQDDSLLRAKHGQAEYCPLCGRQVVNLALGRLRTRRQGDYKFLHEWRNVVRLDWHDGGVLMEAGILDCTWEPGETQGDGWYNDGPFDGYAIPEPWVEWKPFKRFFAAPGEVMAWRTSWTGRTSPTGEWRQLKSVTPTTCKPFVTRGLGWMDPEGGAYLAYRLGSVIQSELRYCAFEEFFSTHDSERYYGTWLISFLVEAARRPQVELLVKLGYGEAVEGLLQGDRGGYNWRAKTPADFFGLSKADFRAFRRSGLGLDALRRYRELERVEFRAFLEEGARLRGTGMSLAEVEQLARRAGVSLHRAVSYVLRPGNSTLLWRDYLDAAEALHYDLQREDVALPKDLRERHDQAAATVQHEADRNRLERYRRELLPQLRQRYAFAWGGLEIIVPECAEEIITEGKLLQHCVGGYAPRHMAGVVTILFLRQQEDPHTPYVTIEMNGAKLCQAHGYRNEGDGATAPRERHKEFFDLWLDWVASGSRRLNNGSPVLPRKQKEMSA